MKLPKGVQIHIGRRKVYSGEIPDELLDKNPELKKSVETAVETTKKAIAAKKATAKKDKPKKPETKEPPK